LVLGEVDFAGVVLHILPAGDVVITEVVLAREGLLTKGFIFAGVFGNFRLGTGEVSFAEVIFAEAVFGVVVFTEVVFGNKGLFFEGSIFAGELEAVGGGLSRGTWFLVLVGEVKWREDMKWRWLHLQVSPCLNFWWTATSCLVCDVACCVRKASQ